MASSTALTQSAGIRRLTPPSQPTSAPTSLEAKPSARGAADMGTCLLLRRASADWLQAAVACLPRSASASLSLCCPDANPLPMLSIHPTGGSDVGPCQMSPAALHLPAGICSRDWGWTQIQPSPWWSVSRGWSLRRGSTSSGMPSTAQLNREGSLCCLGRAMQMEPSGGHAVAGS